MNSFLDQLHDIDGIDAIEFWPLAIGWWVLIGVAIIVFTFLIFMCARWVIYKRSWKGDTIQKLSELKSNLSNETSKETVIMLSEYLRRIVIRRFPRQECASLIGDDWLTWLTKNDPKGFNWQKHGVLLIHVPYAPVNSSLTIEEVRQLIQAVRNWVI